MVAAVVAVASLASASPGQARSSTSSPTSAGESAGPGPALTVGWVGDSIAFQALFDVARQLDRDRKIVFSESGPGYRIRDILPATRRAVNGPRPPDILVVVLGTAQSHEDPPELWRNELVRFLDVVSPRVDCLRVFDIDDTVTGFYAHHDRYAADYNRITHAVVGGYPNAEWYHYEAWAERAGPRHERADILHHDPPGKAAIARLMRHAANTCDPARASGPFWDVLDHHPSATPIAWLSEQGLFDGYPNGTYRPSIGDFPVSTSRGGFVKMAWRLAGRPAGYGPHPWSDAGAALELPLRWAHAEGLIDGQADGTFAPARAIRRIDAVRLLWRRAGSPEGFGQAPWSDSDALPVRWVAAVGLLHGYADGTFRPFAALRRAHAAHLLFNDAALVPAPPPSPASPSPTPTVPSTTLPPPTSLPPPTLPPPTAPVVRSGTNALS